jgi:hypothetical protein
LLKARDAALRPGAYGKAAVVYTLAVGRDVVFTPGRFFGSRGITNPALEPAPSAHGIARTRAAHA